MSSGEASRKRKSEIDANDDSPLPKGWEKRLSRTSS